MKLNGIDSIPVHGLTTRGPFASLEALAMNLQWTWNSELQERFANLNPGLWKQRYGPVGILRRHAPEAAGEFAGAAEQLRASVLENHDVREGAVAYFCAEYGLHESFPIYSGGLGILAGDHCKEASDLNWPFVAVGLFYRNGFFRQLVTGAGRQEHMPLELDPADQPVELVVEPGTTRPLTVTIQAPGREIHAQVWRAAVGRISLLLLDTDVEANSPADRKITSQLYTSGREMRLYQEMVLGIGGARALSQLGIRPAVWHMNEGHSALLLVERIRNSGGDLASVKANSILTIHTPVAAGNERFDAKMVTRILGPELAGGSLTIDRLLRLGLDSERTRGVFDMTAFALRLSRLQNGVSLLHGRTADGTWRDVAGREVIGLTNGVHMPTWLGPEVKALTGLPRTANEVRAVDGAKLWKAHQTQKARLIAFAEERIFEQRARHGMGPSDLRALEGRLDPNALLIGFARRFATYKRADLIFSQVKRLMRLMSRTDLPVQIIFAGKAHPADSEGQALISTIFRATIEPPFAGRVFFLEDYAMDVGRMLVQGVDVWLNNPRRPLEASGTSGMKAAANGIPNLSTLDGWWDEAYTEDPRNGWAIGGRRNATDDAKGDRADANALYRVLEEEVVPCFFSRDAKGVPTAWIEVMKESIASSVYQFSTTRMLRDYAEQMLEVPDLATR